MHPQNLSGLTGSNLGYLNFKIRLEILFSLPGINLRYFRWNFTP